MTTTKRHFFNAKQSSVLLIAVLLGASAAFADDYLLVSRRETNPSHQYKASPTDWRDVNIYQLFTDRFFDGDPNNNTTSALDMDRSGWFVTGKNYPENRNYFHGGDWVGLRQKLDYLDDMGVNAIWISGVQMNAQGRDTRYTPYHMYHPTDFWRCDPTSGTFQELKDLIDDCHSRGIYVILDVVINHMADLAGLPGNDDKLYWPNGHGSYNWWDSNRRHRGSFDRLDWFHHNGTINCWDCSPENLLGQFKGTDDLATERTDVQAELDLAFKNLIAATDCDGFRVDAIKHVEYNWCKKWADDMRKYAASLGKNDFLMFGELFVYDNNALASYCKDEGYSYNSALFFPMAQTIKSVFADEAWTGQLTQQRNNISLYGEGADRLVAFIDNHDVNRISLQISGDAGHDAWMLQPAMTFLYTAIPVPLLYYGTEHCFDQGGHYNGSSTSSENPDDGDHQRECMFDRGFQPGPAAGNKFDAPRPLLYNHIAALNNARRQYKSLTRGSFAERWQEGSAGAYAYQRNYGEEESLVAFNTARDSRTINPTVGKPDGTVYENVLNPGETVTSSEGTISFTMNAKESKIFVAGAANTLSIDHVYHWPWDGEVDPGDDLWINVGALPVGASSNAYVVYSTDGGTTWPTAPMNRDASITEYDGWHVNMGTFPGDTSIRYAVCVQGPGGEVWANNDGSDYTVSVNAGDPAVIAWDPQTPDNCFGSTVDITYTPNSGALAGAAAIELVYGTFSATATNWYGIAMTESGSAWTKEIPIPVDCLSIQICFNNGLGTWDSNNGSNWTIELDACQTTDSDGDSMPDDWELKYGFSIHNAADADIDSDGDGVSNKDEYIAGTDPRDANSVLALGQQMRPSGAVSISWPVAETGRRYTVYRSTNLAYGAFQVLQSNIVGTLPMTEYIDGTATNKESLYYKLRAEVPANIVQESVIIGATPAGGGFSSAGVLVTLNVSGVNVVSSTYTVQGGTAINYSNGETITFGSDMAVGEYRTLTLRGATMSGITTQRVYTFNRISAPQDVTWAGAVSTDPVSGQWDEGESVTITFQTTPIGAAASAGIVYTLNGGTAWNGTSLTNTGSNASNDIWAVTIASQAKGTTLEFALVATDNGGTETWESNGGANYRITVNSDFTPGSDKPYSTNPTLGKYRSAGIVIDGKNDGNEWTDDMLIALDVANDDPRTLGDNWTTHEAPIDFTHLWACWDDNNLYVAWQMVDVTDVIDGANAGSGDPINRNDGILVWMVFDTESGGATNDMWGKSQAWGGPDTPNYMMYMAGSLWQGYISQATDGVFPVDEGEYYACSARGITYANGARLVASSLWGVRDCDNRNDGESALENFKDGAHTRTDRDSFYEVKIPLSALGLTKAQLEASGIGVMVGAGGLSAMDTIPNDPATTDTPGVESYNSSFEWADADNFTSPFARIAAP